MNKIEEKMNYYSNHISDINEHLITLKEYVMLCDHITEFGVREGLSTYALLAGLPKKMYSYDIVHNNNFNVDELYNWTKELNINYNYIIADTLTTTIEETDMLFIDTHHAYEQATRELERHSDKIRKFIIFHDTETFGYVDEGFPGCLSEIIRNEPKRKQGLMNAITEFLSKHSEWCIEKQFKNNNGLTILKRLK